MTGKLTMTPIEEALRFAIDGSPHTYCGDRAKRLSDVLRNDFGQTGTKIGCNAGDCGACTVLIDGAEACACLVPVGQCADAAITTVAGLEVRDAGARLRRAFHAHGAAQCGICTPGMLVTACALLERCATPSRADIETAIGGVLCRCTGYTKILDAILAAATGGMVEAPLISGHAAVGARVAKVDGQSKIDGTAMFGADGIPPDALWVRAIRSPHARATFALGDLEAFAKRHPGLLRILTAADVPVNGHGIYPDIKDQPVLAADSVRYRGEAVLALIGESAAIACIHDEDVPIVWQPLEAVVGIAAARDNDAVQLHADRPGNVLADGGVRCGDPDAAFAGAAHVAEVTHATSFVEHAYIEPEAGWAVRRGDSLEIHVSTQTPYQHRDEVARILGRPKDKIELIATACGGGFGGKLDLNVHPLIAIGAWLTGRPVAYVYSRPESMAASTKRHPAEIRVRAACDAGGRLTAFQSEAELDTGAYASWGPTVATRVPIHAPGPYVVRNARTRGVAYFSNAPPSGAFRGFGVPQSAIASEAAMDTLADQLGMDWLQFRRLNALHRGATTITGQRLDTSVGLPACIDAVERYWTQWTADATADNARGGAQRFGVGIGCSWYGIGNTSLSNPSQMRVGVDREGRITLYSGAVDIGQGSNTIMAQIAADALGVPVAAIGLSLASTAVTLDAGKTSASRQTLVSGKACELAARDLRCKLFAQAGAPDGLALDPAARLHIDGGQVSVSSGNATYTARLPDHGNDSTGDVLHGFGRFDPPSTPLDANGQGVPYACYGFAAQVALVAVDIELGRTRVLKIAAAHDVGRAINPQQVEGQIEGGIAQGLGLALMEEYIPGRTENLHDYLIPTAGDMPQIHPIIIEDPTEHGPFGAKGVGEPALISTAPAILGGIFKATGVRVEKIPALPHRVLRALREKRV